MDLETRILGLLIPLLDLTFVVAVEHPSEFPVVGVIHMLDS